MLCIFVLMICLYTFKYCMYLYCVYIISIFSFSLIWFFFFLIWYLLLWDDLLVSLYDFNIVYAVCMFLIFIYFFCFRFVAWFVCTMLVICMLSVCYYRDLCSFVQFLNRYKLVIYTRPSKVNCHAETLVFKKFHFNNQVLR